MDEVEANQPSSELIRDELLKWTSANALQRVEKPLCYPQRLTLPEPESIHCNVARVAEPMSFYSPGIPTSFDPAIYLHSEDEFPHNAPTSPSHSDDIEALHLLTAEDKINKTTQRVVIQHRAWNTTEVFRSEEDYAIGTSCCRFGYENRH